MPSQPTIRARAPHLRFRSWSVAVLALILWTVTGQAQQAERDLVAAPSPRTATQARVSRFLSGRRLRAGATSPGAAQALAQARAQHLAMLSQPRTSTLSAAWTPLGPPEVLSANFGNLSGRVTSIAIDPADPSGNTVYVGTTGGGVWKSTNAAGSASQVSFVPLTDTLPVYSLNFGTGVLPSLSIGAVAVANGVVLAGTGDTNDATDSYWGEGILRSADGGATWTLAQQSFDGGSGNHSFFGLGVAGFAFSSLNPSLVVAAVSDAAEGDLVNAPDRTNSVMGLYYSTDAGSTWHMSTIMDGSQVVQMPQPLGGNGGGNAATAVAWNPLRQLFIAAVRYHGYYSSPDGLTWTRLASQPGAGLSLTACPTNPNAIGSTSCPMFRGALSVQPATSDTFALTVDLNKNDQGLFQDVCAAASGSCASGVFSFGTQLNSAPLESGSGNAVIAQGDYNLALSAAALGTDTILYAGTIDVYRCSLSGGCALRNTTNAQNGCLNPGGVAPSQHALATLGGASGPLLFTGNDGGLNRSLDGVAQTGAACSPTDAAHYDNLNAAFGAAGGLGEIVDFAQDPGDPNALLAGLGALGTAGTGNPATAWAQLSSGEGGYVAIDPAAPANWYLSDAAGVNLARCTRGSSCGTTDFLAVLGAAQVSNDVAAIHAPFLLDPQFSTDVILGTCRVWRGLATGAGWPGANQISAPLGAPTASACSNTFPVVRSLGAGGALATSGAFENSGSTVLYAGLAGSLDGGGQGFGGHVFSTAAANTANATTAWTDLAQNPVVNDFASAGVFNAGRFDVSAVEADPHDPSGQTVYVTVMGFTGNGVNAPHLYRSVDGGQHWTNISSNLPNAPANSVAVDPNDANTVYVALDTGVYATSTVTNCSSANCWSIFGTGLPNAPAIELAASATLPTGDGRSGELRVGTYGRGIWQIPLLTATAPASAAVALNPSSVSFGTQQVGTPGSSVSVTVTNTGNAALVVSSVVTTGDFLAQDSCVGNSVPPGAGCTVSLTFNPTVAGQRSGILTVYANIAGGQATALLTGVGTAPGSILLTPYAEVYPSTSVGAVSAVQNVTIANTGGSAAQIQSVLASGDFRIAANTCGTLLAVNTSCTVGVTFAPSAAGLRIGTLSVTDSAGMQVASLSGLATNPATDALSVQSLSFAAQALSTSSPAQQILLTNAGDVALTLISSQVVSGDFAVINGCGNSLNPRSSCALSVLFVPTALGVQSGTLAIADQFRTRTIALSGLGVAPPGVSLSPTRGLDLGAVGLGLTSASQTITLINNGGLTLALAGITVSGDFALAPGSDTCGSSVGPDAVCTVAVTFSPTVAGPRTGVVTFSDAAGSSPQKIVVSGMGVDFKLGQDGPTTMTIASGSAATYSLLLNSPEGVAGSAGLTCSGLPANATCTLNPASLPLGAGNTLVTVTVATGVAVARVDAPGAFWTSARIAWALLLFPVGYGGWKRRRLRLRLCSLALVAGSVLGCGVGRTLPGNGSSTPSTAIVTPPGTYSILVAASDAGLVRAVTLTLIVQ